MVGKSVSMTVSVSRCCENTGKVCAPSQCYSKRRKRSCPTMARAIEEKRQSQRKIVRRDRLTDFEQSRSWSEQALAGVHCHGATSLCAPPATLSLITMSLLSSSFFFNYPQRHYGQDNHSAIHFAPASLLVRINTTKSAWAMGKEKAAK